MTATKKIKKGEPLLLPDGTVIMGDTEGNTEVETVEDREAKAAIDAVLEDPFAQAADTYQRTLADVRVPVAEFNPVMLILSYSMWGLDKYAIARFLSLEVEVIEDVQSSELYTETRKQMLEAIRFAEASSIHGFLFQKARKAAIIMTSAMDSKNLDIAVSAAKDTLDRAGFRPVDRVEHAHTFEDELRIVHVTQKAPPKIDVGV